MSIRSSRTLAMATTALIAWTASAKPPAPTPTSFEGIAVKAGITIWDSPSELRRAIDGDCSDVTLEGVSESECRADEVKARAPLSRAPSVIDNVEVQFANFDFEHKVQRLAASYVVDGDVDNGDLLLTFGRLTEVAAKAAAPSLICSKSFPDLDSGAAWRRLNEGNLRAQVIVTIGSPFSTDISGTKVRGIAVNALGVRFYNKDSGEIVCSSPQSLARYVDETWPSYGMSEKDAHFYRPGTDSRGYMRIVNPGPELLVVVDKARSVVVKQDVDHYTENDEPVYESVAARIVLDDGQHSVVIISGERVVIELSLNVAADHVFTLDGSKIGFTRLARKPVYAGEDIEQAYADDARYRQAVAVLKQVDVLTKKMDLDAARSLLRQLLADFPADTDVIHQESVKRVNVIGP